ncbi:MAG TPA: diaminopimelate decarboxylase [Gammaproteobacteria bacterium]
MSRDDRAPPASFRYRNNVLYAEDVSLAELAAKFGTPLYVYSRSAIQQAYAGFAQALAGTPHLICYAVKANSNLAVLRTLTKLGAGFDIVSVGELERVLRAGGDPGRVVFSGVGKRADEIKRALQVGIRCFNVESAAELEQINALAVAMRVRAPVALRINPEIQAQTHPHIHTGHATSKFGIHAVTAEQVFRRALELPGIRLIGLACHIGSQITDLAPYAEAWRCIVKLADRYAELGAQLEHVDFGGGLGIRYRDETIPGADKFIAVARNAIANRNLQILVEPGRALVGTAGVLITRIEYLKTTPHARLLVIDAGMTELLRPSLYDAWHEVREVIPGSDPAVYDVVGPVCESADVLARERRLAVQAGDLLAIMDCGAYGASMGSNYNSRLRPAEVLVDGDLATLVRRRETFDELMNLELLPK